MGDDSMTRTGSSLTGGSLRKRRNTTKEPNAWLSSIRTSAFLTKEKTTLNLGQQLQEKTLQTTGERRQCTRPMRSFLRQRSSVCPDSTSPLTSFSGLAPHSSTAPSTVSMSKSGITNTSCRTVRVAPGTSQQLRVNTVFSNMPQFAEAFQCPEGSRLNPGQEGRCAVW